MPIRSIRAFAKINLGLEVLGKRRDGYHEIRSVFVPISLADVVTAEDSIVDSVVCTPSVTDKIEDNLAYRAMLAIRSGHSRRLPSIDFDRTAKITVEKHIPSGGGLGGGSSDAAAVLVLLHELWSLDIDSTSLLELASSLGSDVPFFLDPATSLVEGRGERISKLALRLPYHIVVVLPGIHVSTPLAYAALERGPLHDADLSQERREQFLSTVRPLFTEPADTLPPSPSPINDFESSVFRLHPVLREIKDSLYAHGAVYASMSGSGSTMYGLFATEQGGKAAVDAFSPMTAYLCQAL